MKTSNYILLSFLIVFIGGNFISHLAAKYNLTVQVKDRNHFFAESVKPFSVVVAEPGANLLLWYGGKNNTIAENYENRNRIMTPYIVRNDTLFVSENPISSDFTRIGITETNKLKSFVAKEKANIKITMTKKQHFSMKLFRSKLLIEQMNENPTSPTVEEGGTTLIQANESDIVYKRGSYTGIELNLINSSFVSNCHVPVLLGSVRKQSNFRHNFFRPGIVNLKVDKSSSCFIQ